MRTTDTIIVGAGQAGLAVSRLLSDAQRDHVLFESGRVGERWLSARWDSMHLLTPTWINRLPGAGAARTAPDGFLSAKAFAHELHSYAVTFRAPVLDGITVVSAVPVDHGPHRFEVVTSEGAWRCRHLVVATGAYAEPVVPRAHRWAPSPYLHIVPSNRYRNPDQVPEGGVLVVGASATGTQIAEELNRAGREVLLAVGRHTRMPRTYRGMDIFWWLQSTGRLARTIDEVSDPEAARNEPSMQLAGGGHVPGSPAGRSTDLGRLHRRGVRLTGRVAALDGRRLTVADDLAATVADSERRMHRFLDAADQHATSAGLDAELDEPHRPSSVELPAVRGTLDLQREGVTTVVLAAGLRPHNPWLEAPVTDARGTFRQHRGVTEIPGLYVVGQRYQHRRDSVFIGGVGHDARYLVDHLTGRTDRAATTSGGVTR